MVLFFGWLVVIGCVCIDWLIDTMVLSMNNVINWDRIHWLIDWLYGHHQIWIDKIFFLSCPSKSGYLLMWLDFQKNKKNFIWKNKYDYHCHLADDQVVKSKFFSNTKKPIRFLGMKKCFSQMNFAKNQTNDD